MKKFLILAASAMALSAAPAIAQVFPAPGIDNSARITQTGNFNEATINQAVGGIINGQGLAEIIQSSNRGVAMITQRSFTSPRPAGFANEALLDQRRVRAVGSIEQIHDYQQAFGNQATIVQVAQDAQAAVQQRGDRNFVNFRQRNGSVTPVGTVQQNGIFNRAVVFQDGINGFVQVIQGYYSDAIGVSPDSTRSRLNLTSAGVNADIYVTQIGVGNEAVVSENGINGLIDISSYGDFNLVEVEQNSANGVITVASYGGSQFNFAGVVQDASDFGSTALIEQYGSFGTADILQQDLAGLGGNNKAGVEQTGAGTALSGLHSLTIQDGANNQAYVAQASNAAQSFVLQTGAGHLANVAQ